VYQYLFAPPPPPAQLPPAAGHAPAGGDPASQTPRGLIGDPGLASRPMVSPAVPPPALKLPPVEARGLLADPVHLKPGSEEQLVEVSSDLVEAVFTSQGGRLRHYRLLEFSETNSGDSDLLDMVTAAGLLPLGAYWTDNEGQPRDDPGPRVGVLSGPSFATEVAAGMPTVVVAAAADQHTAESIQHDFASLNLRVYSSTDVTGVEVGGVVKNVIAIATGAGDGLGLGHNARAATITRALAETQRLAAALGARPETLWGLSGVGDLVLTCTGDLSRNRQFGLRIGRGEDVEQILGSMRMVVEGVRNTRSVKMLADRHGVEMPIVETCYEVLYNGMAPSQALSELLGRSLKPEFH